MEKFFSEFMFAHIYTYKPNVLVNDLSVISLHRFSCRRLKALCVNGILFRTLNTNILSQTVYKMSLKLIHIWTSSGFPGVFSIYAEIFSAYSPFTHKEVSIRREQLSHSILSENFIAEVCEKPNSGDTFGHIKINFWFLFFRYLWEKKLLYAYTENTHRAVFNTVSVNISVNNNTNLKNFYILSIYTIWDG